MNLAVVILVYLTRVKYYTCEFFCPIRVRCAFSHACAQLRRLNGFSRLTVHIMHRNARMCLIVIRTMTQVKPEKT